MGELILVIDAGTTSTRAMLFGAEGKCLASAQQELAQHYPRPGWVEHDAGEIWDKSLACAREAAAGREESIACIGITNQRETICFWSRRDGKPLAPAIVWQDRRTAKDCARLKEAGHEAALQAKTGLLLDPYFSASKIAWAMREWPQLKEAGDDLAIGTVESYLIYRLTACGGLFVTDASNASRTALMDIHKGQWDEGLLDLFGVPRKALPEIVDCAGRFLGTRLLGPPIPICGMAGDQQAAAIGQACFKPGETKATYGTGAFVLTHTGAEAPVSGSRLLTTIAWQLGGERRYALEGSVFVAGSLIQWLRDSLGIIASSAESETLARSVSDNGGVFLVPALSGLGAPYWQPEARAALTGLSFAAGRAHVVRAALEAQAHQTHDLMSAFAGDGAAWASLRIDGGMAANDWLAQDLADMLGIAVERPAFVETTALGAAMLAGLGIGLFGSLEAAAAAMRGDVRRFEPAMSEGARAARLSGWRDAVAKVLDSGLASGGRDPTDSAA